MTVQAKCNFEVLRVDSVVWRLTGSARLLGHRQGDLSEGKDVDLWAVLGGRRGQGGEIRLVLLSLSVVKLLVQKTQAEISHPLSTILPAETVGDNGSAVRALRRTEARPPSRIQQVMCVVGCIVWANAKKL